MLRGREQGEVLAPHFIQIIQTCKLLSVTDELCELKQLVPPVRLQEPTAARYNCDDTTIAKLGQTYGHFKTECHPFFLLEEFDSVTLKAVRYHQFYIQVQNETVSLTVFEGSSCRPYFAIKVRRNHKLSANVTIAQSKRVLYEDNTLHVAPGELGLWSNITIMAFVD